ETVFKYLSCADEETSINSYSQRLRILQRRPLLFPAIETHCKNVNVSKGVRSSISCNIRAGKGVRSLISPRALASASSASKQLSRAHRLLDIYVCRTVPARSLVFRVTKILVTSSSPS